MNDSPSSQILVVEDSATQALRMQLLLEQEGLSSAHAASAEEALDHLSRNHPDLVLVDYHLPGMRGDELCRQMRMNPATSDIMILILTDDVQGIVERQGLESGADDHVPKSTDPDALMARIHALLRNQRRLARPHASGQFFQRQRVVVVDDSPTFLEFARQQLEADGYQVTLFEGAQQALGHLGHDGCDCLIVDLMMPGMGGIELCQRLDRLRARTGSWFPILMMASHESKDDMMRALEAGVDDFINKSTDIAIVRARIRALLRRKTQRDEQERIGDEFRTKELEVVRARAERQAAERRAEISEALEARSRELREAQAQLIQAAKMASLGELVAGIAHEVNNPIAYVMSHLDTVGRNLEVVAGATGPLPERAQASMDKARTRLGEAREGLERVKDLVLKLRTFSRLDEGEFKRVDVRESIDSVLAMLRHRLRKGSVRTEIAYAQDNAIACYPAPLNQVVMNLVGNAIDAVDGEGTIWIRTERTADAFRIVVADSGPGVPDGLRDRVFEPFFTTKPVGIGVGLGLAIAYRIIQTHRGTIAIGDRAGGGAEFTICLPLDLEETSNAA